MSKIKAILVDDEESARNILSNLLEKFCPQIELLGSFKNVEEAVHAMNELKPQLVFLDIEMPNYAGYEIIDFFEEVNFEMIFVTAYDQYAVKAFEVSAVDYLLKPIEIDRLKDAIERVSKRIEGDRSMGRIVHLSDTLKKGIISSIIVSDRGYQYTLNLKDIIALEAQESYCRIHTTSKNYIESKNLKHFEKLLGENENFVRVHKSWIINRDQMVNYSKSSLIINMNGDITAKLSKYKKADFERMLTT